MHEEIAPSLDKLYYPQILLSLCYEMTVMTGGWGGWGESLNVPEMLYLRQSLRNDCGSLGIYSNDVAIAQNLFVTLPMKLSSV